MTPLGRLKVGLRAARRRRKGYAVLRRMRSALGAALALHLERTLGGAPYASQFEALYNAYRAELLRLRRRFPRLDLGDERALP